MREASSTFPLDVACGGVSWPTQLWLATAAGPRTWLMLMTQNSSRTAMFTVSPSSAARRSHICWPSRVRSSCAAVVPHLLNELVACQHRDQPKCRRLVYAELRRDLGHS